MKPFDLEKALAGDPIVTRNRKPCAQVHEFECNNELCIAGVVDGEIKTFTKEGVFHPGRETNFDLFMAPKVREYWVNVYRNKNGSLEMGAEYESEEKAKSEKQAASHYFLNYISTIKLTEEI